MKDLGRNFSRSKLISKAEKINVGFAGILEEAVKFIMFQTSERHMLTGYLVSDLFGLTLCEWKGFSGRERAVVTEPAAKFQFYLDLADRRR